ncbi:MAG: DUF2142 domain-containing protein [Deltaproteobacteria bacterium]|nr:DUF2142 domain-containing protein [Deltaproteobacteria bacterium]
MIRSSRGYIELPLVFIGTFLLLSLWAFIKPPFQAPDEFVHHVKTASTGVAASSNQMCVPVRQADLNPLVDISFLHAIPFHAENSLLPLQLRILKSLSWPSENSESTLPIITSWLTSAYSYPYPFYLTLNYLSAKARAATVLTPYQAHYVDRLIVSLLSALAWTLFYALLRSTALTYYRLPIYIFLIFNPVLLFVSSSINPDALFIPLANCVLLLSYKTILNYRYALFLALGLVASLLLKSPAFLLLPIVISCPAILALIDKKDRRQCLHSFCASVLGCLLAAITSYLLFYRDNVIAIAAPTPGRNEDLATYLLSLWERKLVFFSGYWSLLGWTDYSMPYWLTCSMLVVLVITTIAFLRTHAHREGSIYIVFFLAFFAHVSLLIGLEYHFLAQKGYIIQGRYFLPLGLCLSLIMVLGPEYRFWRRLSLGLIVFLSAFMFNATVIRYHEGSYRRAYRTLPFVNFKKVSDKTLNNPELHTDILHCKGNSPE